VTSTGIGNNATADARGDVLPAAVVVEPDLGEAESAARDGLGVFARGRLTGIVRATMSALDVCSPAPIAAARFG
jgi:hypothetical protein